MARRRASRKPASKGDSDQGELDEPAPVALADTLRDPASEAEAGAALAEQRAAIEDDPEAEAVDLGRQLDISRSNGRLEDAERLARTAVRLALKRAGASHPDYAVALGELADVLFARGKLAEAREVLERRLSVGEAYYARAESWYAEDLLALADLERRTASVVSALALARQAIDVLEAHREQTGEGDEALGRARELLAELEGAAGVLHAGDRVVHPALGEGVVEAVHGAGPLARVSVTFGDGRTRKLDPQKARLERA